MPDNIRDKVVVITGASSGIGAATARHLATLGATVVLGARRGEPLAQICRDITAAGGLAAWRQTDVTVPLQLQSLVDQAVQQFGRVDVLVNNAGLMAIAPIEQARIAEWDRMIDINLKGVLYGVAAVLPHFTRQGSGHIINISSVCGSRVFTPGGCVYSGTKFAVNAISEGIREELAGRVRVTTILPGAVDTGLKYGSSDPASLAQVLDEYHQAIPADHVAHAIAYAISQPAEMAVNELVLRPAVQAF